MAQACELTEAEAMQRWHNIADLLTHRGRDPHWRRQPSVLAQLRGCKSQPLACKKANSGDASHRN